MLHNGGSEIREEQRGGGHNQQQHCRGDDSTLFSRAQVMPNGPRSPTRSAQSCSAKTADNEMSKQPPPFKQHRPSVLRKGNGALSEAGPQVGHSSWDVGVVCKAEPERTSPPPANPTASDASPCTRQMASQQGHCMATAEHNIRPSQSTAPESALYIKGFCRWPDCNEVFKDYGLFLKHLGTEHGPGEKSSAQWRMHKDMVQYMEDQLVVEKQRLQAMQIHLWQFGITSTGEDARLEPASSLALTLQQCQLMNGAHAASRYWNIPTSHFLPGDPGLIPNIESYKYRNLRPPFTYAHMIRWAILESPEKQLTLNDIYHWFTRMFYYFRANTATWKNAVRHNLSLHKCFVRVEGAQGSVWTVDEDEFLRKRGQKLHRDHDLSWMVHYPFLCS